ncbi:zinc finger MYM-type protein 1-like [Pecten maximus]|uniref:zinc finger MYM-type protein 1-like n=1 Tax=Pecten maximus TaxID=6579 RepID=UPI001458B0BB|nr:zinc finger MYM-type protein 1-like [Pecten maximus]
MALNINTATYNELITIHDEATDCSTKEQIALCVRYFNRQQGEVCEEFLGYREASITTGQALAETFLEALGEYGININQMRGQGYDGATNMAGVHRGVQARIRERVPLALYTHCIAHSLNLSIVHSCKETIVRNMMDTVQTVAFAFDYSAKRLMNFEECLVNDD